MRVAFRMNGERFLPTALASMTAKYLRELAMRAFNEFWSAHVPRSPPHRRLPERFTPLPQSHRRKAARTAIDDHAIWRNR